MSDQEYSSSAMPFVPLRNGNREVFIETLRAVREASEEMVLKVYELESLVQELKAVKAEVAHLKVAINAAAIVWELDPMEQKSSNS